MCTLIAAIGKVPGYPLVVAANRDERLDRPASGLRLWPGAPAFVAPRDDRAGGTWLGFNAHGMFVGVTNRFLAPLDETRDSRGKLVTWALGHPSAKALHRAMSEVPATRYNAFHLLYADHSGAFVTWSDGTTRSQEELSPGVHIVCERSFGGDVEGRLSRIQKAWAALPSGAPNPDALFGLLRMHGDPEIFSGTCIHASQFGYGTRSSTLLLVPEDASKSRLFEAAGPPCQNALVDASHLLGQLPVAPSR